MSYIGEASTININPCQLRTVFSKIFSANFILTELPPTDNLLPMQDLPNPDAVCILYAEDDPPSGRLVRSIAESEGYTIKVAATGKEFLTAISEFKPNLLLIDLHLPDALGLDLLSQ